MQVKMCITRNTPHRTDVAMHWGSVTTLLQLTLQPIVSETNIERNALNILVFLHNIPRLYLLMEAKTRSCKQHELIYFTHTNDRVTFTNR